MQWRVTEKRDSKSPVPSVDKVIHVLNSLD